MAIYKNYGKPAMKEGKYRCGTERNMSRSKRIK